MKSVRSKNRLKQSIAAICAVIMISSVCFSTNVFATDTVEQIQQRSEERRKRIEENNKEIERLGQESKESNEYLKAVNEKIKLVQEEIDELNEQIEPLKKQISSMEKKIKDSTDQIAEIERQLPELDTEFNKCFEEYGMRMRAMYITGTVTNLELMLTASDISSMFTRAEMIRSVSKKDADALNKLTDTMQEIKEKKEKIKTEKEQLEANNVTLLTSKSELDEALALVEERKAVLVADKKHVDDIIRKIAEETGEHTDAISKDEEAERKDQARIQQKIAEDARREAEKTTTTTKPPETTTGPNGETQPPSTTLPQPSVGKFTIPCPNYSRISGRFPSYSSGSYHSGLDFAAPIGTNIVAAEAGRVIISEDLKNSDGSYRSYGKYILISHKTGLYTLYAHTSERLVSEGDYVEKGQLIAKVGSTGNSTGPHLHFEVRTGNGSYSDCVNPEDSKYLGSVPYSR